MLGFYLWRCGTAVSATYHGKTFAHDACHTNDAWLDFVGGGHTHKDRTGGWHDAGDYNKYTVNAGLTVGTLLRAWEDFGPQIRQVEWRPGPPALGDDMTKSTLHSVIVIGIAVFGGCSSSSGSGKTEPGTGGSTLAGGAAGSEAAQRPGDPRAWGAQRLPVAAWVWRGEPLPAARRVGGSGRGGTTGSGRTTAPARDGSGGTTGSAGATWRGQEASGSGGRHR